LFRNFANVHRSSSWRRIGLLSRYQSDCRLRTPRIVSAPQQFTALPRRAANQRRQQMQARTASCEGRKRTARTTWFPNDGAHFPPSTRLMSALNQHSSECASDSSRLIRSLGSLAANALSLWLTGVADFSSVQKAASKTAAAVNETMISLLKDLPSLSVAPDRGKEFARYREVSAALNGVPFYFPPPQSP